MTEKPILQKKQNKTKIDRERQREKESVREDKRNVRE